jgi:hypothetical protein
MTEPGDPSHSSSAMTGAAPMGPGPSDATADPFVSSAPPDATPPELVPPAPSTSGWPSQAADTIVDLVDQVRAKTTGPAITAARALVFGLIVAVLAIVVGVLALVFLVRLTTEVLVLIWDGAGVWLTYLIYGVVFTAVGVFVFGRRHARGLD